MGCRVSYLLLLNSLRDALWQAQHEQKQVGYAKGSRIIPNNHQK